MKYGVLLVMFLVVGCGLIQKGRESIDRNNVKKQFGTESATETPIYTEENDVANEIKEDLHLASYECSARKFERLKRRYQKMRSKMRVYRKKYREAKKMGKAGQLNKCLRKLNQCEHHFQL